MRIVELAAEQTHPIRRRVLRDGTPSDVVEFDGDDRPTTRHLGAMVDGRLVAVSTWVVNDHPDRPGRPAVQLRGMATDAELRSSGVGATLLQAGIERARAAGAETVWARARVPALDFYRRHGFSAIGDEYDDPTTAIPHRDIAVELA